jgi:hypothetical protein
MLALGVTLLNAAKPLHIDDAAYVALAAHIAQEPLTPYGFELYWDSQFQPANRLLAPPVVPYWIAGAMRLFGDHPAWWKFSLLPFHLLLVFSLDSLFRRFAGARSLTLVVLTVVSPALLPASNLMLDVPALALSLAAVAVFLCACERSSWPLTLAAGMLAGLAMETKYTAFVTPAVFLAHGATHRQWRRGLTSGAVASVLFVAWEAFVALQHGASHFWLAAHDRPGPLVDRLRHLALPLLTMTASVAPATLLIGLYAITRSLRCLAAAAVSLLSGFLLIGFVPETAAVYTTDGEGRPRLGLESVFYTSLALLFWTSLALVVWRLFSREDHNWPQDREHGWQWPRATVFLLLWLVMEVAAYFAMSPFAASRRVLGVVVVATLLTGRLAGDARARNRTAFLGATAAGATCAILVAVVDLQEALAAQHVLEKAEEFISREQPGRKTWFYGAWSMIFYARHDGLEPIASGRQTLHAGDVLVLAEQPIWRLDFQPEQAPLAKLAVIDEQDALPWRTVACYYCGRTPLQHHEGPRLRLTIYRVLSDFVPSSHGVLRAMH